MTNERRLAEIDIDGAEKRAEFILAHHASDVCWRSCRTLTEVDLPALIARIRELEAENERLQGFADRLAENGGKALREAARLRGQAAMDAKVREAAQEYVAAREASSKAFIGVFETVDMTDELREQRYAANYEAEERLRDAWHTLQCAALAAKEAE